MFLRKANMEEHFPNDNIMAPLEPNSLKKCKHGRTFPNCQAEVRFPLAEVTLPNPSCLSISSHLILQDLILIHPVMEETGHVENKDNKNDEGTGG